jgi:hypothetical protein
VLKRDGGVADIPFACDRIVLRNRAVKRSQILSTLFRFTSVIFN